MNQGSEGKLLHAIRENKVQMIVDEKEKKDKQQNKKEKEGDKL